ncbi:hypothetical protein [Ureibacillus manganicus]|uniref:Uncharacterized protein n=1 Tax=Ureibacillus manganicus DSM 26584 TaxID=1384049 RepID=A0A0A3I8B1_9BACL|nr:hypothetical protein [Ureibacillus manganicus]KGR78978.1 hypothetical protein CD29_08150 [Ureibacillus manganicus DSM 26584]
MSEHLVEANISRESKSNRGKTRSPFLMETTAQTIPQTTPSLYTIELFERSNKAVKRLKDSSYGEVKL